MKGWMALLHGNKDTATGSANFSAGRERPFYGRPSVLRFGNSSGERDRSSSRSRMQELNTVFGCDRARRMILSGDLHELPGRCPVTVTVQQSSNDSAIQHALERFVAGLRVPLGDKFIPVRKTSNPQ